MNESDNKWKINPKLAARIAEIREEQKQLQLNQLEQARGWGRDLNGELAGFCGHLTGGAGAREYPVFRQEDGRHFISMGPKEDLYMFKGTLDDYIKVQEEVKNKCKESGKKRLLILSPEKDFEERNGKIIQFINPNYVFGRKMQSIKSWMKE